MTLSELLCRLYTFEKKLESHKSLSSQNFMYYDATHYIRYTSYWLCHFNQCMVGVIIDRSKCQDGPIGNIFWCLHEGLEGHIFLYLNFDAIFLFLLIILYS